MTNKEITKEIYKENSLNFVKFERSEGYGKPALSIDIQSNQKGSKIDELVEHVKNLIKTEDNKK